MAHRSSLEQGLFSKGACGGRRLTVLAVILHACNMGRSTRGYFSAEDEYSRVAYPYSNEREMLCVAADPEGAQPGRSYYDGILAHEFQHMIHWAHHRDEGSWVNEGMFVLAVHLNGFNTGSPAFMAVAEKILGRDLRALFDAWVGSGVDEVQGQAQRGGHLALP